MLHDGSKHVTKRSGLFPIPGRVSDRNAAIRMHCLPTERHETGEAEEERR